MNHADVALADMSAIDGWGGSEFRACLGAAQGIGHTASRAVYRPGESFKPHRFANADAYYMVAAGAGRAGVGDEVAALSVGSCVHAPAGTLHWFESAGDEPLAVIGLQEGAGSLAAAGFEAGGEIPAAG